jgi:uncharacterized metal-binding protein
MPAYRTHVKVNLCLGLPVSLVTLKYTGLGQPLELVAFSFAFIYGTFFLHPDLDLTRNIRLFSIKGLLTLPFRPYSYFFRHRGISHFPLIGTLLRLAWLLFFLWLVFSFFDWAVFRINPWNQPAIWFGIAGLAMADLIHIVLDRFSKKV